MPLSKMHVLISLLSDSAHLSSYHPTVICCIVIVSVCPHPSTCGMITLLIVRSVKCECRDSTLFRKPDHSFDRAATLFTYKQTHCGCFTDLSHSSLSHSLLKQQSFLCQQPFHSLCLMLKATTVCISISISARFSGHKITTKSEVSEGNLPMCL